MIISTFAWQKYIVLLYKKSMHLHTLLGPIAQSVRAPDSSSGSPWFKPKWDHEHISNDNIMGEKLS